VTSTGHSTRALAQESSVNGPARVTAFQQRCGCVEKAAFGLHSELGPYVRRELQRKLSIGATADPQEAEADWIADQALSTPRGVVPLCVGFGINRRADAAGSSAIGTPPSVDRVLASRGRPLDGTVKEDMEQRFGHDFSRVRVHTDADAERSATEVDARAYTVGEHIAFAPAQFSPHTDSGRLLLAHELAHVTQRSSNSVLRREPTGVDEACTNAPSIDIATVPTPILECASAYLGDLVWSIRLWNFERGKSDVSVCHEAALNIIVNEAGARVAQSTDLDGWSVTSVVGHASPEGEESFNQELSQKRAEAVAQVLAATTTSDPVVSEIASPLASGEQCASDVTPSEYPWWRAVDIGIEFSGESPVPPQPADPRTNSDREVSGVSYELDDPLVRSVEELFGHFPPSEIAFLNDQDDDRRAVLGWLIDYRDEIVAQETVRGIDRRAIAGAIAWEALVNVQSWWTPSRAAGGPGKVHSHTNFGPDRRVAAPEEVEIRGLIPRRDDKIREELLRTPIGAIDYIGAIMQAMAQDAESQGFDIWRDPAVLTWGYRSKYVDDFRSHMERKAREGSTTFDTSSDDMAAWVTGNLHYLELAVGKPASREPTVKPDSGNTTQ
jgi:hypothetical protein